MKMKKMITLLLVSVLVLLAVACAPSTPNKTEAPKADGAKATEAAKSTEKKADEKKASGDVTTITMMGWYDEGNWKPAIDALNKALEPEKIKVEYTFVTLQSYNDVLSTQLASGKGADILCDGANFPARIKAGNLLEITNEPYLKNFNSVGFGLCGVDGKVYGIPSYGWYSGMFYNKDLFEKNGLTPPNTFDELVAVCDKFKEKGVQPLGFGLSNGDTAWHSLVGFLENEFYHKAGEGFDSDFAFGRKKMSGTLDSYVEKWYTLIKKGHINDTMLGISNEQALADFISGKTAMLNSGPWFYKNIKDGGIKFGMIAHLGSDGSNKWLVGGPAASYGINAKTPKVEAAKKVMAALASQPVQQAILDTNVGAFSYFVGIKPQVPSEYDLLKDYLAKGNVGCCWDRWSVNMPSQSMVDEGMKQLQSLIAGSTDVKGYLAAMDAKADSIRYQK